MNENEWIDDTERCDEVGDDVIFYDDEDDEDDDIDPYLSEWDYFVERGGWQ